MKTRNGICIPAGTRIVDAETGELICTAKCDITPETKVSPANFEWVEIPPRIGDPMGWRTELALRTANLFHVAGKKVDCRPRMA